MARLLTGRSVRLDAADATTLLNEAGTQGVKPWLAWQASDGRLDVEDSQVSKRLREELRRAAMAKLAGDAELVRLFDAAQARDIRLLVFKGEALARFLYPEPATRPTADFDLLVDPEHLPGMQDVLEQLGYHAAFGFRGVHLFAEQYWTRKDPASGRFVNVDLHWDISNRRYYRARLGFDEMFDNAIGIAPDPGLVRAPSPAHSLIIACVHLAGRHAGDPLQLKWLLDIWLLLEALDDAQWAELCTVARARGLDRELRGFTELTALRLGPVRHLENPASPDIEPGRIYRWTRDYRWFDLLHYAWRLPGRGDRKRLWQEAWRHVRSPGR